MTAAAVSSRRVRVLTAIFLATASLALSGCGLFGGAGGGAANPTASPGGDTDVFTIKVGNCLNDSATKNEVTTVPAVDCAHPHDSEAYASITMTDVAFPGADAVKKQAESGCTAKFNSFVGVDYGTSKLAYSYYYPTAVSWAQNDREILCLIADPAGQTTGSLKGAAR